MHPRVCAAALCFLLALASARAEESKDAPADVKALLEKDLELCNAGDWTDDAKLYCFPMIVFDEVIRDPQALIEKTRSSNEGVNCKLLSCEVLEQKAIVPRLTETARGFLNEKDTVVRWRVEAQYSGQTTAYSSLVIIRQADGKPMLAGFLTDPDKNAD